ncbi:MBL fold metallo-hydrolase [Streptomyces noursei]|uniref:MBL fold metallo-hydrolase n=1 Tax=Streptomyces noursei TaxID=1971 RepID=UPI0022BF7705|nr:MBL fold metallo-hydrolase [Streptomyces noursei]
MPWICLTCGNHDYHEGNEPPVVCVICADDRQWVPAGGQRWSTLDRLKADGFHSQVRDVEPGLVGIGAEPVIGIGQRGLLLRTDEGNVLWDPSPYIDDAAIQAVRDAGGLRAISSSHPHFYGAIVAWSQAFDAEILLPQADIHWLSRPAATEPLVTTWEGTLPIADGVTLVQCGGHFPGSSVLHWAAGAEGRGLLLTGDTINISPGEDRVAFLYSAPNRLPLPEQGVHRVVEAVRPYPFDRLYGHWWEPAIRRDAQRILQDSTAHYLTFMRGTAPSWVVDAD